MTLREGSHVAARLQHRCGLGVRQDCLAQRLNLWYLRRGLWHDRYHARLRCPESCRESGCICFTPLLFRYGRRLGLIWVRNRAGVGIEGDSAQ